MTLSNWSGEYPDRLRTSDALDLSIILNFVRGGLDEIVQKFNPTQQSKTKWVDKTTENSRLFQ